MSTHSKAAAKFIADAERTAWHDKALYAVREKNDKMARTVPEWVDLRRMSSEIKRHTLSHLAHYLEEFERNATANGMVVHWAADADEMNATVWRLVQEHGGRNLIKSKSMLSEECGLTPYLRERGVDAVESDLGERIMQLLELPPSHIVLPAIGVRREGGRRAFRARVRHRARQQRSHLPDARGSPPVAAQIPGRRHRHDGRQLRRGFHGDAGRLYQRGECRHGERRSPTCISPSWGWRRLSPTCGRWRSSRASWRVRGQGSPSPPTRRSTASLHQANGYTS